MILDRIAALMALLLTDTVFGEFVAPIGRALDRVRNGASIGRSLTMQHFIMIGVLRHLQGTPTLREQVQILWHLDPAEHSYVPLPRSTWSDALGSSTRRDMLRATQRELVAEASKTLPDRLADIPGLGKRPVRAIDGTYQQESVQYHPCTPKNGGEDNPKGHAILTFFNVRLGIPEDTRVETKTGHEIVWLREYDRSENNALTRERNVLWLVDRAFIDAAFWDKKKRTLGSTIITRMKSSLRINSQEDRPVAADSVNDGVLSDVLVLLESSPEPWRIVTYRTRNGRVCEFLTNDFTLEPGVIAFLYTRRWEEEKCFDTWKNDFSQAKAWGKSIVAIENQTRLAIITSILVALMLQNTMGCHGIDDEKSLDKQDKRQNSDVLNATDRPDWTAPLFRFTTKTSRQVLRFFKCCFLNRASPELYERELKPILLAYL